MCPGVIYKLNTLTMNGCTTFNESLWVVFHTLNTSTTNIYVIALTLLQGSPYNWRDTTLKKQSPANQDCNKPEVNKFALIETQYLWFRFLHFIE